MTDDDTTRLKDRVENDDDPDATYYVPPNCGIKVL